MFICVSAPFLFSFSFDRLVAGRDIHRPGQRQFCLLCLDTIQRHVSLMHRAFSCSRANCLFFCCFFFMFLRYRYVIYRAGIRMPPECMRPCDCRSRIPYCSLFRCLSCHWKFTCYCATNNGYWIYTKNERVNWQLQFVEYSQNALSIDSFNSCLLRNSSLRVSDIRKRVYMNVAVSTGALLLKTAHVEGRLAADS